MSMTDPIADMLTRIRNALQAEKHSVQVPYSNLKMAIAKVLCSEGYIEDAYEDGEGAARVLCLTLKYYEGTPVIEKITRISKPGLRQYAPHKSLPSVQGGLGIAVVSTPKGVMTDKAARSLNIGGEVLCTVV